MLSTRTTIRSYPGRHHDKGLVLRAGIKCVGHLDGDENGKGHSHGFGGTEDLAGDTLEVLGVAVALHVVGQLPEGHLNISLI